MTTVPCCRCGLAEVPAPKNIEEDPICLACKDAMYPKTCPGWGTGEDCGNPKLEGSDLCGDCHGARLDYESPHPGNPR